MNIRFSLNLIGIFLMFLGGLMLLPVVCSFLYHEDDHYSIVISAAITFLSGFILWYFSKAPKKIEEIERKDAFLIAALFWFTAGIFGSLPYLLYGVFSNPADGIFESVSGFTTTGASAISNIEVIPHGILFWRNLTQWLGGMGIIVLAIAVLPKLSVGGMQLMRLEAPGPTTEKITPQIAVTAKKLWTVYIILSVALTIILIFGGMSFYDSIMHTLSTMSTGGFSPKNASIAAYNSSFIDVVLTVFMFLAGANFILHYSVFTGNFKSILKSTEFRFYLLLNLFFTLLIALQINKSFYGSFVEALRFASFQVISISTTTGFATADFDLWPSFSKFILLTLMFIGGCSGSTSGAVKVIRFLILFKKAYQKLEKLIYPKIVSPIRLEGKIVDEDVASDIASFFLLYILIAVFSTMVFLLVENVDILTGLSAVAT
ncbi:MAG: TrkH family potassium uptake protein, partial [Thermodesulfobacteriota bacterium]